MHDYSSENISNDIFQFSVRVIELEFQPIGRTPLFHHFRLDSKFVVDWTSIRIISRPFLDMHVTFLLKLATLNYCVEKQNDHLETSFQQLGKIYA